MCLQMRRNTATAITNTTVPTAASERQGGGGLGGQDGSIPTAYTATTAANVISTAGDATLSVSDPGRLANGTFSLTEPLRVELSKTSWTAPVSNEQVAVTFRQHIAATQALRTGTYSRTLTFTLSTTTP